MEDNLFTAEGLKALGQIVKQTRGKLSFRGFEEVTGISHTTIRRLEREEVQHPDMATLKRLAPQTDYTLEQLIDVCRGQPVKAPTAEYIISLIDALPPQERIKVKQHVEHGYEQIPLYDANPSAGYGSYVETVRVLEYLPFRSSWIRCELRVNPSQLHLVHVEGMSMEPTLRKGDLVMVNTAVREVRDGIYVIWFEGAVMVKRLQKLPRGRLLISSDHEAYVDYQVDLREVGEDFHLIGQVIWAGKLL